MVECSAADSVSALVSLLLVIGVSALCGAALGGLCVRAWHRAQCRDPDRIQVAYFQGYYDSLSEVDRKPINRPMKAL